MKGAGNYAVRWKLHESKSYEGWSKIDDFVWIFLVNKALELVERKRRICGKSLLEICCGPGIEMQYLAKKLSLLASIYQSLWLVKRSSGKEFSM